MDEPAVQDAWHPENRRELLPGPSARTLGLVSFAIACVALGAFGVFAVLGLLAVGDVIEDVEIWPTYVALFTFFLGTLFVGRGTFSPLLWVVDRRADALAKECTVDVVDAPSRRVIRLAGEHLVESKYDVDRVNQIRDRTRMVREPARRE